MAQPRNGGAPQTAFSPPLSADRRDHASRRALVDRIRGEFLEMRGVSLTERQTARLMGVPQPACERILRTLIREGCLRLNLDGRYMVADAMP